MQTPLTRNERRELRAFLVATGYAALAQAAQFVTVRRAPRDADMAHLDAILAAARQGIRSLA